MLTSSLKEKNINFWLKCKSPLERIKYFLWLFSFLRKKIFLIDKLFRLRKMAKFMFTYLSHNQAKENTGELKYKILSVHFWTFKNNPVHKNLSWNIYSRHQNLYKIDNRRYNTILMWSMNAYPYWESMYQCDRLFVILISDKT